jgi:hypothetical protein
MAIVGVLAGLALIVLALVDGFEAMVLPRRVTRPLRPARLFYRLTWPLWEAASRCLRPGRRREAFLSVFGPLSLLSLFVVWVAGLIVGFALLHFSLGSPLKPAEEGESIDFLTHLYLSGVTFFTLGYGDVVPLGRVGRALAVLEAGLGFGFLAVIIGYLPALYQAFSRREVTISLLDARAGSPPSAAELLVRLAHAGECEAVGPLLVEWERWSAELLESHLSFPVLSYYRSQHYDRRQKNQVHGPLHPPTACLRMPPGGCRAGCGPAPYAHTEGEGHPGDLRCRGCRRAGDEHPRRAPPAGRARAHPARAGHAVDGLLLLLAAAD